MVDNHIKKELQGSPAEETKNVVKPSAFASQKKTEAINPYLTPRKITGPTDEMLGIKSLNQLRQEKGFFESDEDVRKRYWENRKAVLTQKV